MRPGAAGARRVGAGGVEPDRGRLLVWAGLPRPAHGFGRGLRHGGDDGGPPDASLRDPRPGRKPRQRSRRACTDQRSGTVRARPHHRPVPRRRPFHPHAGTGDGARAHRPRGRLEPGALRGRPGRGVRPTPERRSPRGAPSPGGRARTGPDGIGRAHAGPARALLRSRCRRARPTPARRSPQGLRLTELPPRCRLLIVGARPTRNLGAGSG